MTRAPPGMSSHDNMKMTSLYTLKCEKNGGHELLLNDIDVSPLSNAVPFFSNRFLFVRL